MLQNKWFRLLLWIMAALAVFLAFSYFFKDLLSETIAKVVGAAIGLLGVLFGGLKRKN